MQIDLLQISKIDEIIEQNPQTENRNPQKISRLNFEKQRDAYERLHNMNEHADIQVSHEMVMELIYQKNIDQLYQLFINQNHIGKVIFLGCWQPLIQLLINEENLRNLKGIHILSILIMHCCSRYQQHIEVKNNIIAFLHQRNICETMYELACYGINKLERKLIKLYLYFLKNCALVRIQDIRSPRALQKYLPILQKQFLNEASVLIILTYIGQEYKYSPEFVAQICNQGLAQEPGCKIIIANILLNYVTLQNQAENIRMLFDHLLGIFQHIYMNCHKHGTNIAGHILNCFVDIIGKYPQNCEIQLLQRIQKSKIQNFFLILLQVSTSEVKLKVYIIEQVIIEKCINNLGAEIFNYIDSELIDKIMEGLQFQEWQIQRTCIKMLAIICQFSSQQKLRQMNKNQLLYVLKEMKYHKDQFISESANQISKYFQQFDEQENQMNIQ